jgi:hypothetical protein
MIPVTGATGHAGARRRLQGWRHSATTWSQWSEPQAPANWNRAARCGLGGRLSFCRGRSRASMSDGNAILPYPVGYASGITSSIICGRGDVATRFILLLSADAYAMQFCKQGLAS